VREREESGGTEVRRITIEEATSAFVRDAEARGLRPPSVDKYKLLFKQLTAFADDKGLRCIVECDVEVLRAFRESWVNKNFSARKKLEAMRTFFRFIHESGWLPTNPAKIIKPPKVDDPPTLPYPKAVLPRVLAACDQYPDRKNAVRLRALTLLLRYSGLRGTDAVTLTKHSVKDGVLVLRTAKTGTDVRVPLPQTALDALAAIPTDNYSARSNGCTKSLKLRTATCTDGETRSRWNCCWLAFRWNRCRFCLATSLLR
jgi:site-specific recombinase XerD